MDHWDLGVYLTAPARRDGIRRWADEADDPAEADHRRAIVDRYITGQAIYEYEARPTERADVAINNDDPAAPRADRPAPW